MIDSGQGGSHVIGKGEKTGQGAQRQRLSDPQNTKYLLYINFVKGALKGPRGKHQGELYKTARPHLRRNGPWLIWFYLWERTDNVIEAGWVLLKTMQLRSSLITFILDAWTVIAVCSWKKSHVGAAYRRKESLVVYK